MSTLHYLAYGSNLHPLRLGERIPSSRPLGLVELPGYALRFHKRGSDGSGKCNLHPSPGARAWGAVYEMAATERPILDAIEGAGYAISTLHVELSGRPLECFVYLAEGSHIDDALVPHDWYHEIVLIGARYHGLPGPYLRAIEAVTSAEDPHPERGPRNAELLRRLRGYDGR